MYVYYNAIQVILLIADVDFWAHSIAGLEALLMDTYNILYIVHIARFYRYRL